MTGYPATPAEVRAFVYRQGPGKRLLGEQHQIDDDAVTTAFLPPPGALGPTGVPLPTGSYDALAAVPFPLRLADRGVRPPAPGAADPVGAVLATAFGLQRREPDHQYPDHRATASGRARYPVHAFLAQRGRLRYVNVYRHALVDVEEAGALRGDGTDAVARLVLAARYSDLPAPYGRLRFTVCETELGVALRALCVAADVFGVAAQVEPVTAPAPDTAALPSAAGPGAWSAPIVVRLPAAGPPRTGVQLPGVRSAPFPRGPEQRAQLRLLESAADEPSVAEARAASALRGTAGHAAPIAPNATTTPTRGLREPHDPTNTGAAAPTWSAAPDPAPSPARGLPETYGGSANTDASNPSWADVLWRRSGGRVAGRRYGFALRPAPVGAEALRALLAWAAVPPPDPVVAAVGRQVRTTLVLAGVGGLPDGVHRLERGEPRLHRAASGVPGLLEPGFGRPSSPTTDIGLRHASVLWVHSADTDALLDAFGPGGPALLALWCGWTVHGLCLAAAAHGLMARPARSFDEHHLQPLLGLSRKDVPVFMTVCGTPRPSAPVLDLRV